MSVIDEIIGLYDEEFGHEGESVVAAARAELAALRADVAKYDDAEEWRQHYLRRTNDLEEISGGLRKRIEELDSVLVDYDDLRQRVAELEQERSRLEHLFANGINQYVVIESDGSRVFQSVTGDHEDTLLNEDGDEFSWSAVDLSNGDVVTIGFSNVRTNEPVSKVCLGIIREIGEGKDYAARVFGDPQPADSKTEGSTDETESP